MAARLTDKQKKKIVADYVQLGSYNAVSKIHGVSATTVKNVVLKSADIVEKCEQKKEKNTADIIAYMESQRNDVCEVLKNGLEALKASNAFEKSSPREIATTMAILIDKYSGVKKDMENTDGVTVIVDV